MKTRSSFSVKIILALALIGALLLPAALPAFADIMIMPIRIVFGSRDRMQDIMLFNSANDSTGTYTLSWIYAQQTETGGYKKLDHPLNPELDPETAILFSPRQVTLPPGSKQRVRMSLRRPPDLPDGEYRAHLNLKNMARQRVASGKTKEGANIGVGMNVGLAVPVIIRQGPYDGTATIGQPHFNPGSPDGKTPPQIIFFISRGGKFSTIGNVKVYWMPPDGGEEKLVGVQNAVNIYPEVPRREMTIPLREKRIVGGKVHIIFEGDGPDKGITFDEKIFPVGG